MTLLSLVNGRHVVKFLQRIFSQFFFIGTTIGGLVLIAIIFQAVNFAYFAAVSEPDPNIGTGTASWNLFRWRNVRATPPAELPDWVLKKGPPPPMTEEEKWKAVKALRDQ